MEIKTQAQGDTSNSTWWKPEEMQGRPKKKVEEMTWTPQHEEEDPLPLFLYFFLFFQFLINLVIFSHVNKNTL